MKLPSAAQNRDAPVSEVPPTGNETDLGIRDLAISRLVAQLPRPPALLRAAHVRTLQRVQ